MIPSRGVTCAERGMGRNMAGIVVGSDDARQAPSRAVDEEILNAALAGLTSAAGNRASGLLCTSGRDAVAHVASTPSTLTFPNSRTVPLPATRASRDRGRLPRRRGLGSSSAVVRAEEG